MGFQEREYEDILQRLEECGSYEISASPRDISKLSGIRHLLSDLGDPHRAFRIIHIAGSTGKGLTGRCWPPFCGKKDGDAVVTVRLMLLIFESGLLLMGNGFAKKALYEALVEYLRRSRLMSDRSIYPTSTS